MIVYRVVICAILVLACSSVSAQDHEIRMFRPAKVGDTFAMTAVGFNHIYSTILHHGLFIDEDTSSIAGELAGTVTVMEVDEYGRETKMRLIVSQCEMSINEKKNEEHVLAKGSQVIAQVRGQKTVFVIDGKAAPSDIEKLLKLFIKLPLMQFTDDVAFGTKERKKIGDSWAIDNILTAKKFTNAGIKLKAENIKGSTKLVDVLIVDSIECLHLNTTMEVTRAIPHWARPYRFKESKLSVTFSGEFPVDTTIGCLSEAQSETFVFEGEGMIHRHLPELMFYGKGVRSVQRKFKYLQ